MEQDVINLFFDALMIIGSNFEYVIFDFKIGVSREVVCKMVIRYRQCELFIIFKICQLMDNDIKKILIKKNLFINLRFKCNEQEFKYLEF